jgi:hypothetical protein
MRPEAPEEELYAVGSPLDSLLMMPSTQSTRSDAQYCSTSGRHVSTLRCPPESAGQFGDHFDDVDPAVVVVADVVGVAEVLLGAGAFVVVVVVVVVAGGSYSTTIRAEAVLPAESVAVKDAPLAPGTTVRAIDQVPSLLTVASYGPDWTVAPFSTVPLKVTTLEVTVSPSSGDVIAKAGGLVSLASG